MARHKLMTKALAKTLPPLYSQERNPDPMVVVKFFNPAGAGTWYGIEFDPKDNLFFGWVDFNDGMAELGYFSLVELENLRIGPLFIERDLYWTPAPLSKIKSGETS